MVISWAKELCNVLHYLHSQKPKPIIHRDLKPGNIIITPEGEVKLIDFGISNEEYGRRKKKNFGTPHYAAPEQYTGRAFVATDIYSLGATLYNLLTGTMPPKQNYMEKVKIKTVRDINPKISLGLEYIISKCMEREVEKRYTSVEELLNDLNNINKINKMLNNKILKFISTLKRKKYRLCIY